MLVDWMRDFGTLIFPSRCLVCGAEDCHVREPVCSNCLRAVPLLAGRVCERCGVPDPGRAPWCASCRARPPAFRFARCVAPYDGVVPELVRRFKYQPCSALAASLARLLRERDPLAAEGYQGVVAVPLASARLLARGFNQAALLARGYAEGRGRGCYWPRVLARRGEVATQASSGRVERRANVVGAFQVRRPREVRSRRLLLIDDVITTGATVDACARALLDAGAEVVDVLALARTGRGASDASTYDLG